MANVDAPRGLVPVKMLGNKYETAGFSTYKVASGYNQNLFNVLTVFHRILPNKTTFKGWFLPRYMFKRFII